MSLAIDPDNVTHVLLADGWHKCDFTHQRANSDDAASSFDVDAYEFYHEYMNWNERKGQLLYNGGSGFSFTEKGVTVCGPISAILAVKHVEREPAADPNYVKHLERKRAQS